MTEPSWYNVDPGESDALINSTKMSKFKSKTYESDNPKKFQDLRSQKVPSSTIPKGSSLETNDPKRFQPVYQYLERYYHREELNLSGKHLSHLDISSLANSFGHKLKKLDLSGCGLTYSHLDDLKDCHGLEELNLSNNPLYYFYFPFQWEYMCSLKKLDLSGCGLTDTDLRGLEYSHGLEELNLSNNPLYHFHFHRLWKHMSSLKKLDLSGCGLTNTDLNGFENFQGLKELNLSNNPLHDFVFRTGYWNFLGRHRVSLRSLNLSGCCLTKWPSGLKGCSSLQELNLSNNFFGHQDLLENLNNGKTLSQSVLRKSEKEILEPAPSVLGLPNLNRIIFEDAVYKKNNGVWTVEERKDVLLARPASSSTISTSTRRDWRKWQWHDEIDWRDKIHEIDEINERPKSVRLTVETYNSMSFSLRIICNLLSNNVENCLERKSTLRRCFWEIFLGLNNIDSQSSLLHASIVHLKRHVSWLISSYFHAFCDVKFESELTINDAREAFLSKSSPTADRALAAKLVIIIKILQNLTKPEDAVLYCLQWLQKLHEVYSLLVEERDESFKFTEFVLNINKNLFQFVRMFSKPPLTAQEWPGTIKLVGQIYNPLIDVQYLKQRLIEADKAVSSTEILDFEFDVMGAATDFKERSIPIIETLGNSITVNEEGGGCFHVPVASAILVFSPEAVWFEKTLMCSRVKYSDCKVNPREGEFFVSRILKMEPERLVFNKAVTVLLSHSLYEDQDFLDFYELVIENVSAAGLQELKTERISSIADIPKEVRNPEILEDYLPVAKATIHETCTLVAAARVRSHQIFIPTNRSYIFSKQYGENTQLKITFPAGVTEEIQSLNVQIFPADAVLNKDVYLDKNLVCAPVIKVSGQTTPFLEAVHVELTYSNSDVVNIEEEFLPVGNKMNFTTKYGLLLRSQKETQSTSKCQTLNESSDVYIERPRKDQLKFSFSLKHFCKLGLIAKKTESAPLPNVQDNVVNQSVTHNPTYVAIALAVHNVEKKMLYAVLADKTAQGDLKEKWKIPGSRLAHRLKNEQDIFICVPLDNNTVHLPLDDCLRFDIEMPQELPNKTSDVDLNGEFMYFWPARCTREIHCGCEPDAVMGKIEINIFEDKPKMENNKPVNETLFANAVKEGNDILSAKGIPRNGHVTPEEEEDVKAVEKSSPTVAPRKENRTGCLTRTQDGAYNTSVSSQKEVMKRNLSCCEHFEKEIGNKCLEKLGINKNEIQNPAIGPTAQLLNDAGTVSSVMLGLGVGVTLALSIGSFGIGSIVGATVAGVTFTFSKISKTMKKSNAKKLDRKVEVYCHFHLKCIIIDVAKELSRMFEYQLVALKDRSQIDTLAECAVDLMLDLKEGDRFDRDTLLKKVLQDGNIKKRKLLTKDDNKWSAPSVFRKPGLQRTIILTDRAAFTHHVNRNGSCKPGKYGYRGQFLETRKHATQDKENEDVTVTRSQAPTTNENYTCEDPRKELCKECSFNYENCINGEYFVESDIDSHYDESQDELKTYYPIHILVQCPKILNSFIDSQPQEEELSFANFLKKKFCLPEDRLVQPVYRQHSPGKVPDLQNSDLTGSDFSHSDFTNSCLENCNFTNCVMLFAKLPSAKMSGSIFCDTLISHSNLTEVKADHCIWVKTSLLFSRVDGARFDSVDPSIGGNCLDGTNICFANIQKKGKKRKRNDSLEKQLEQMDVAGN